MSDPPALWEILSQPASTAALAPTVKRVRKLRRLVSAIVRLDAVTACDDGAQIVERAGEDDHDHVNDEEDHEAEGAEEVDGARALPSAEDEKQFGKRAIHGGRHGEAGQHDQRAEDEDHGEIGELLQHVVVQRLLAFGEAQMQVIDDVLADIPQVALFRQQVAAEMAAGEGIDRERQSVEHEQPCEEEMPLAARGERTPARQGRPGGEAAHGGLAEYFGGAEDAGGVETCAA